MIIKLIKYIFLIFVSISGVLILDIIIVLLIGTIFWFENIWSIIFITIGAPIPLGIIGIICVGFSNIIKVGPNKIYSQKIFLIICIIYFGVKIIDSLLFYFLGGDTLLFSEKVFTLYTFILILSYLIALRFLASATKNIDEKGMKKIFY